WLVWIVFKFVLVGLSRISQPVIGPLSAQLAAAHPRSLGWLDDPWAQATLAGLATVLFILAVGALARRVVGQRLLAWIEALFARIPLVKTVYGSARKLLDLLQAKPDGTRRVVLIDF